MRSTLCWLSVFVFAVLAGCARSRSLVDSSGESPRLRPLDRAEAAGDLAYRSPFAPYATAPTGGRGRVFLVALSGDLANFAQEVADQRPYWRSRGVSDESILCYYVMPTREDYRVDRAQFDALREELASFYAASPSIVAQHLREAAAQRPEWVYVYLTGHGGAPWSFTLPPSELDAEDIAYLLERWPQLDDYHLASDAAATGTVNLRMKLHAAEQGAPMSELFVTPAVVRDWLTVFPDETQKVVVMQACYSGGFLERHEDYAWPQDATLRDLPGLTAIAAARYDRPSFGCSPGENRTVFGGVWLETLWEHASPGAELDWSALFRAARDAVDHAEAKWNIPPIERSRPVLLETTGP